jgi:hypothetical protein
MKHGKGVIMWLTDPKNKYEGGFVNNMMHGYGVYHYAKKGYRYEGDFFEDQRHGQAVHYYKRGKKYVGGYKNNLKHGKGYEIDERKDKKVECIYKDGIL